MIPGLNLRPDLFIKEESIVMMTPDLNLKPKLFIQEVTDSIDDARS